PARGRPTRTSLTARAALLRDWNDRARSARRLRGEERRARRHGAGRCPRDAVAAVPRARHDCAVVAIERARLVLVPGERVAEHLVVARVEDLAPSGVVRRRL